MKNDLIEVDGHLLPKTAVLTIKKFNLSTVDTGVQMPLTYVRTSHEGMQIARRIHAKEGNDFQEFFYTIFLNRAHKPTGYYLASMGGVTGTVADPRLILKAAALADCTNILLCHNHPSGSTKPSRADEELTLKIREAAKFFDIGVLDHIILGENEYYSFADEGLI